MGGVCVGCLCRVALGWDGEYEVVVMMMMMVMILMTRAGWFCVAYEKRVFRWALSL